MTTRNDLQSRRDVLKKISLTVLAAGAWGALGCGKKELSCSDTAGLSAEENAARTTLGYVDKATDASKVCSGCTQYNAAGADQCGGCKVLKGPINPNGYCKAWAAKA